MLSVKNIVKYYGTEKVLNNISFNIEKNHKIALIGFNGIGKSTLLRILAGIEKPDNGKIEYQEKVSVGYIPQTTKDFDNFKVVDFIKDYVSENKKINLDHLFHRDLEVAFAGFGLKSEVKEILIKHLSSGQKTKVFLTATLLKKSNLYLFDEPTNNLDLPALIWLEEFLKKADLSFIMVSHDKRLLDNVANKIYELDWETRTLKTSNGKYSDYLNQKQKDKETQNFKHILQKHETERLDKLAKWKIKRGIAGTKHVTKDNDRILQGYLRDKAGDSFKDAKVVYGRIRRMKEIEKPLDRKTFELFFNFSDLNLELSEIKIKDLISGYTSDNHEFQVGPINLDIKFGQRICIIGLNGSGKTTILKTINHNLKPISGSIDIGPDVRIGNLTQEHENLDLEKTVVEYMMKKVEPNDLLESDEKLSEEELLDLRPNEFEKIIVKYLRKFGFKDWQLKMKIETMSPGSRAKLLFAYFAILKVNTLILDEPTNHLDREVAQAFKDAVNQFKGTILVVTHDRSFIDETHLNTIYKLEDNKLEKIDSFKDYLNEIISKSKKSINLLSRF